MNIFKNTILYQKLLLIFSISASLLIAGCGNDECYRISYDKKQSIEHGAFICEYQANGFVRINDSISFTIVRAFAEKQYRMRDKTWLHTHYKVNPNACQLVIATEPGWGELWENYGYWKTWEFSNLSSANKYCWNVVFDSLPIPPDTIRIDVVKIDIDSTGGAGIHNGDKIGDFFLIKK